MICKASGSFSFRQVKHWSSRKLSSMKEKVGNLEDFVKGLKKEQDLRLRFDEDSQEVKRLYDSGEYFKGFKRAVKLRGSSKYFRNPGIPNEMASRQPFLCTELSLPVPDPDQNSTKWPLGNFSLRRKLPRSGPDPEENLTRFSSNLTEF